MNRPADVSGRETAASNRAQLHAPFRSRRGRLVGTIAAVGVSSATLVASFLLPRSGADAAALIDRLGFVAVALFLGWALSRFARVAAVPSEQGLVIRNLVLTRRLDWAEVVGIHYGGADPWVVLDLSDGDNLAVMAIQRADGERATREAGRLATLIALHSPREP